LLSYLALDFVLQNLSGCVK